MNLSEDLRSHELCCHIDKTCTVISLSKKCHNFSDSLTMGINILICLFSYLSFLKKNKISTENL